MRHVARSRSRSELTVSNGLDFLVPEPSPKSRIIEVPAQGEISQMGSPHRDKALPSLSSLTIQSRGGGQLGGRNDELLGVIQSALLRNPKISSE